jgi:serine/threonine protein kinase
MKKLDHPNLVGLIEVLDDPEEDSLYMVMEMCKKGVVMKVGLDDSADPYPEETCRHWFRDLILGVEYCEYTPHRRIISGLRPDSSTSTRPRGHPPGY